MTHIYIYIQWAMQYMWDMTKGDLVVQRLLYQKT